MKKLFLPLVLFFMLIPCAFAKDISPVSFSAGLSTGHVFYGASYADALSVSESESESSLQEKIVKYPMTIDGGYEILIGATAGIDFNLSEYFSLYADLDLLADFIWLEKDHSNHLDYSGSAGIRFYPYFGGLSVSAGYLLGCRADFIKTGGLSEYKGLSSFGNGLKFSLEYNFARDFEYRFLPTIGASWRWIPRGNNFNDNVLSAYVKINF